VVGNRGLLSDWRRLQFICDILFMMSESRMARFVIFSWLVLLSCGWQPAAQAELGLQQALQLLLQTSPVPAAQFARFHAHFPS